MIWLYAHIKFLFGVSSSSSPDARVGHVHTKVC